MMTLPPLTGRLNPARHRRPPWRATAFTILSLACLALPPTTRAQAATEAVVFDFAAGISNGSVKTYGGTATATGPALHVMVPANQMATLNFSPPSGVWDFSKFAEVEFVLANPGTTASHFRCRISSASSKKAGGADSADGFLEGGGEKNFRAVLFRDEAEVEKFPDLQSLRGLRGLPGGFISHWRVLNPEKIAGIQFTLLPAPTAQQLDIRRVFAAHPIALPKPAGGATNFFPFIDRFGQYKHAEWPGKTHTEADLQLVWDAELQDLRATPAPGGRDQYGGWADGPQLEATGHFRTEKRDGRWWLVDPEGRLFWSMGVNGVKTDGGGTPLNNRRNYFEWLPKKNEPLGGSLYDSGKQIDFLSANRCRKFGPDWQEKTAALTQDRLHNWGLNTIGAWSDPKIFNLRRTPYTVIIHARTDMLRERTPNPFSEKTRAAIRAQLAEVAKTSANDPWCLGYFIENEINWGGPEDLVGEIFKQPATSPAKAAFGQFLRTRHPNIAALNHAWATQFKSWDGWLAATTLPAAANPAVDFKAFQLPVVEAWHRLCRDEIRRAAPHKLFLGSRLHGNPNPALIAVAAKYCDVISYNLYRPDLDGFGFKDIDKPFIATEFSFGALDRGMFWTGGSPASDQQDRAKLLKQYIRSGLENPAVVGVHWFIYSSQPVTGRGDGENGQIGLVDICDTPYPETVTALREINRRLYEIRAPQSPR